jgi:hypothetical protein
VDEDQILCLQRLYPDPPNSSPTLRILGRFWKFLFEQSQRTQFTPLTHLCIDLEMGKISTAQDLRSQLEAIADQLQPAIVITESVEDPDNLSNLLPGTHADIDADISIDINADTDVDADTQADIDNTDIGIINIDINNTNYPYADTEENFSKGEDEEELTPSPSLPMPLEIEAGSQEAAYLEWSPNSCPPHEAHKH